MNSVCALFLARNPTHTLLQAVHELTNAHNIDSCIISDTHTEAPNSAYISSDTCTRYGFKHSTHPMFCGFPLCAWDRAFYFSCKQTSYDYYWFIEDDVYFDTVETLAHTINQFRSKPYDLIATDYKTEQTQPEWCHWHLTPDKTESPISTFNPFCRVSRKVLDKVSDIAHKRGELFFHEIMLGTFAKCNSNTFYDICTSDNVVVRYRPCFTRDEINQKTGCILHPFKLTS